MKIRGNWKFGRREFLKRSAIASLGLGLASSFGGTAVSAIAPGDRSRRYTPLGRTGMQISDTSFGASRLGSGQEALVVYAFDRGINYFDSAETYMGGESETTIGNALRGKRDKVFLTSKVLTTPSDGKESIMQALEGSLRRLQTDHID